MLRETIYWSWGRSRPAIPRLARRSTSRLVLVATAATTRCTRRCSERESIFQSTPPQSTGWRIRQRVYSSEESLRPLQGGNYTVLWEIHDATARFPDCTYADVTVYTALELRLEGNATGAQHELDCLTNMFDGKGIVDGAYEAGSAG